MTSLVLKAGFLAPRRDKVQSRIMPCACKRWCAWTRADRLPGVTVLARLVAQVRDQAASRL